MKITAIILTGGKSSRMGSDKALLVFNGQTLLNRAVDFCAVFCNEILISSNNPKHNVAGIQRIDDEIENCGPIGGLDSSLKKSSNDWNFVWSVDAPFVQLEFVDFLISKTGNFDAVVPVHKVNKEPLIALYHKKILPQVASRIEEGNYKMHFLLQELNTNFVESGKWLKRYPELFRNLNNPDDKQFLMRP